MDKFFLAQARAWQARAQARACEARACQCIRRTGQNISRWTN